MPNDRRQKAKCRKETEKVECIRQKTKGKMQKEKSRRPMTDTTRQKAKGHRLKANGECETSDSISDDHFPEFEKPCKLLLSYSCTLSG